MKRGRRLPPGARRLPAARLLELGESQREGHGLPGCRRSRSPAALVRCRALQCAMANGENKYIYCVRTRHSPRPTHRTPTEGRGDKSFTELSWISPYSQHVNTYRVYRLIELHSPDHAGARIHCGPAERPGSVRSTSSSSAGSHGSPRYLSRDACLPRARGAPPCTGEVAAARTN